MNLVAASFAWPFRGQWQSRWLIGLAMVILVPIAFIPLLGYAIAATRAAGLDPGAGPPRWALTRRILADGFWVALAIALVAAPFALALGPLSGLIAGATPWHVSDPNLSRLYAELAAAFILALPWGLVMLLLMPHVQPTDLQRAAGPMTSSMYRPCFRASAAISRPGISRLPPSSRRGLSVSLVSDSCA